MTRVSNVHRLPEDFGIHIDFLLFVLFLFAHSFAVFKKC